MSHPRGFFPPGWAPRGMGMKCPRKLKKRILRHAARWVRLMVHRNMVMIAGFSTRRCDAVDLGPSFQ